MEWQTFIARINKEDLKYFDYEGNGIYSFSIYRHFTEDSGDFGVTYFLRFKNKQVKISFFLDDNRIDLNESSFAFRCRLSDSCYCDRLYFKPEFSMLIPVKYLKG